MFRPFGATAVFAGILAFAVMAPLFMAKAADKQVKRGEYLVTLGGCSDCHTPGSFLGHPDSNRFLGGSDVGFAIPGLGVFAGSNLTPDGETGLRQLEHRANRDRTNARTAAADGRMLAPNHAVAGIFAIDAFGRAGDNRLSQKLASGEATGPGSVWPERQAVGVCHVSAAGGGLQQPS